MTEFTRAHLGKLPADAVLEDHTNVTGCPRCGVWVTPFEQARWRNNYGWMQITHYDCPTCGVVWGSSYPINDDGTPRR